MTDKSEILENYKNGLWIDGAHLEVVAPGADEALEIQHEAFDYFGSYNPKAKKLYKLDGQKSIELSQPCQFFRLLNVSQ